MDSTRSVKAFFRPYVYWHDLCQTYYSEGLRLYIEASGGRYTAASMSRLPGALRALGRVRNSTRFTNMAGKSKLPYRIIDGIAGAVEGGLSSPSSRFNLAVGQYLYRGKDGGERKICIDAADSGNITSPELLEWSDIYFKSNFWKDRDYPSKVRPMYNANPYILGKLPMLRSLRATEKLYDLCFIVRVWGGTNETEGVEHNVRLIEAVSKADCRKFLYAYLVAGDIKHYAKRLDEHGIPWSTEPMPLERLWDVSAQSRLSVIRLGMHYCVPWRMADTLAMGGSPVLDSPPFTAWPEPLRENENFFSLGVDCGLQKSTASEEEYSSIPAKIESWLAGPGGIKRISENNCRYFDRFLAPEKIGEYIIRTAEGR